MSKLTPYIDTLTYNFNGTPIQYGTLIVGTSGGEGSATWSIDGGQTWSSGTKSATLEAGTTAWAQFGCVSGWVTPQSQGAIIPASGSATITGTYFSGSGWKIYDYQGNVTSSGMSAQFIDVGSIEQRTIEVMYGGIIENCGASSGIVSVRDGGHIEHLIAEGTIYQLSATNGGRIDTYTEHCSTFSNVVEYNEDGLYKSIIVYDDRISGYTQYKTFDAATLNSMLLYPGNTEFNNCNIGTIEGIKIYKNKLSTYGDPYDPYRINYQIHIIDHNEYDINNQYSVIPSTAITRINGGTCSKVEKIGTLHVSGATINDVSECFIIKVYSGGTIHEGRIAGHFHAGTYAVVARDTSIAASAYLQAHMQYRSEYYGCDSQIAYVSEGGTFNNAKVEAGGTILVGNSGIANYPIIYRGGTLSVTSGGSALNVTSHSGCTINVAAGGTITYKQ